MKDQTLVAARPEEGQLLTLDLDGTAEPEEEFSGEHPNFIESNTLAISIEILTTKVLSGFRLTPVGVCP